MDTMIGAADLFRAWNDVGANGLSEVERIARAEYRDGDASLLRQAAATRIAREPTILRRFAAVLHLVRVPDRVPAATPAGIHPGIAAVHFAEARDVLTEPHLLVEPEAAVLTACGEDCGHVHAEYGES